MKHISIVKYTKMSIETCVTIIAGILEDHVFNHICFIAENLATLLPNFNFKRICKSAKEWKPWLRKICKTYGWSHTKSPLTWREIGVTHVNVTYIGGSYQFWEFLYKYYRIKSHLTEEDLNALQADFIFAHKVRKQKLASIIPEKRRQIMVIGAGRTVCLELIPQLIMIKELWLTHGTTVNLYDVPGYFFKLKKIFNDSKGVGGGLNAINTLENIPDGLKDCDILIYLDVVSREDQEGLDSWLKRSYKPIEELSMQINEYAPSHMKVIFCSMNIICFYVSIMHELVKKLPKTSIVAVSLHYGLEVMYAFVNSLGFTLRNFGCPPVWGYLGINRFVDVDHMIQKCNVYEPNKRALNASENATLPLGIERSELRWFFYIAHDKNLFKEYYIRKALAEYQVGRTDDYQKCKAICDLLKLWYNNEGNVGDEIISLGISSDGSFGIPKGLVFSQPVCLKVLEDQSRVWVPFKDFPMPNLPPSIFQNFINTAIIITKKITKLRDRKK